MLMMVCTRLPKMCNRFIPKKEKINKTQSITIRKFLPLNKSVDVFDGRNDSKAVGFSDSIIVLYDIYIHRYLWLDW